jgi:hypothetical protein
VIPRLRTVALLMLAAGLSLGVFAAKALSTWHLPLSEETPTASPIIEESVRYYQRAYRLDETAADLVRQELLRYDQQVMSKLWEIRRENAAWFEWAQRAATARLEHVVGKKTIPPAGLGLGGEPVRTPRGTQETKEKEHDADR